MTKLPNFNRTIALTVTRPIDGVEVENPNEEAFSGVKIDELNIDFSVSRTTGGEPNTLTAKIYNVNEDTRNRLQKVKGSRVLLEAGYDGKTGSIFSGDLKRVSSYREGPDIITEVFATDGERAKNAWFQRAYPADTNYVDVIGDLAAELQIDTGNLDQVIKDINSDPNGNNETNGIATTFKNGITVSGYALNSLGRLLASRSFEWSIQDNKLQILRVGASLPDPVIKLTVDTGLLGVPAINKESILEAQCQMIREFYPGRNATVESRFIDNGTFKIIRADYNGSLYGQDFSITFQGKRIEQ